MRLIIADDHVLIRAGIRRLVESLPGWEVIGEANNGQEALELLAIDPPDVLLLDISMPGTGGLEVLAEIQRRHAERIKVLMLSMHSDHQHVHTALSHGAAGFLVKDAAPAELEKALTTITNGQKFLSAGAAAGMTAAPVSGPLRLPPRQREILEFIAQGYSAKEIADHLLISAKTVETHRVRMMKALGLTSSNELLRYALDWRAAKR